MNRSFIPYSIFSLLGLAVFSFIVAKASLASFTHDESFTYLHFMDQDFMDLLSHKRPYANNHLLNSMLMKYSELLFGYAEWALRLPNLLASLVFFSYTFLLVRSSKGFISLAGFMLIVCNPILLDLFALARGYGLSIAFMTMSVYYLFKSLQRPSSKNLLSFNLAALLAILGNFTMLDYYLAALLVYNLISWAENYTSEQKEFSLWRHNRLNLLMLLVFVIILYEPVRRVVTYNTFDFGGKQGLVSDTVASLTHTSLQHTKLNEKLFHFLQWLAVLLVLIPFFTILNKVRLKDLSFFRQYKALAVTNLLLVLIGLGTVLQHYIFNTDYLQGRFAVFLFPLFMLNVFFLLGFWLHHKFQLIVISSLAGLSLISFGLKADLYVYPEWSYDSKTRHVMKLLVKDVESNNKPEIISLGTSWLFEPTLNFYRQTWKLDWLHKVERHCLDEEHDYYYLFQTDVEKVSKSQKAELYSSEQTKSVLLKDLR